MKRGGNESANEQRKSGLFLSPPSTTLPSCGPCLGSPCSIRFASELSESDALSDDLPNGKIEAASVIQFFAVIEAKHLFVKVAAKMKRFDRNVRPRNAALEKRPEILKAVGVYAAIYVLSRMVNDLMSVIRCQSVVGHERIAVERRASGDVFANFVLQHGLAATRDDGSADLPAPLQDAHDCGLSFVPVPVMRRLRSETCMFRALPPMKVSSTSTSPPSLDPKKSSCIARRIRCSINHADFWVTLTSRAIS